MPSYSCGRLAESGRLLSGLSCPLVVLVARPTCAGWLVGWPAGPKADTTTREQGARDREDKAGSTVCFLFHVSSSLGSVGLIPSGGRVVQALANDKCVSCSGLGSKGSIARRSIAGGCVAVLMHLCRSLPAGKYAVKPW